MELKLAPPDPVALLNSANASLELAKDYIIDSPDMYQNAAEDLRAIKTRAKDLDKQRLDITGPLLDAKRKIDELFKRPLEVLESAAKTIERSMVTFQQEERRKADELRRQQEEEQRKERERMQREAAEAQRKADEEAAAKRREAEAEAARIRQEAAEKAAAAKSADEAARIQREAEERAVREQQEAEEAAQRVTAEAEEQSAAATMACAVMSAPVVRAEIPKAAGTSSRQNWKCEVTDLMALVKAVAEGKAQLACLKADETVLNGMARALKDQMQIPGVRVYAQEGITSRRAA